MRKITLGGKRGGFALVDDADYAGLLSHGWSQDHHGYAGARIRGHYKLMHQLVNATPKGQLTDHINRNKLDNRRANLRTVDWSENARNCLKSNNQCGTRGVWFDQRTKRFCAAAHVRGKRVWCGRHTTIAAAKLAYDQAVL